MFSPFQRQGYHNDIPRKAGQTRAQATQRARLHNNPRAWMLALALLLVCGCDGSDANDNTNDNTNNSTAQDTQGGADTGFVDTAPEDTSEASDDGQVIVDTQETAVLHHSFGALHLDPYQETSPCFSWTLNNDAPLYVEKVTYSTLGSSHHSNWFVVPETAFEGADGYWDCDSRGFSEIEAALRGTVLFAQTTQSLFEEQKLGEGIVVKIPPRHRVIASGHFLNLANRAVETEVRLSLELIHPSQVKILVSPFRFSFYDLNIHPQTETRFSSTCDLSGAFSTGVADIRLYWLLPHYHYLGNAFRVNIIGGARDGEEIFSLDGFNAEPGGKAFGPPLDLAAIGATGLRFECGFNNPRDSFVGWGIGDQEMCVMLGFMESPMLFDMSVNERRADSTDPAMYTYGGDCGVTALPKNALQKPPSNEEIAAPLYVPGDPADPSTPFSSDTCVDTPASALAEQPTTLASIRENIFVPSCTYSSCHGGARPIAGLDLLAPDLHGELLNHAVQTRSDLPLVTPGDPDNSLLYQMLSRCEPASNSGGVLAHMPFNSPLLLEPVLVQKVRQWIADGAQNN